MPVKLWCPEAGKAFRLRSVSWEEVEGREFRCPVCKSVHGAVRPEAEPATARPRFHVYCQDCGREVPPDAERCGACGLDFAEGTAVGFDVPDVFQATWVGTLTFCPRGLYYVCHQGIDPVSVAEAGDYEVIKSRPLAPDRALERLNRKCLDERVRALGGSMFIAAEKIVEVRLLKPPRRLRVTAWRGRKRRAWDFETPDRELKRSYVAERVFEMWELPLR